MFRNQDFKKHGNSAAGEPAGYLWFTYTAPLALTVLLRALLSKLLALELFITGHQQDKELESKRNFIT